MRLSPGPLLRTSGAPPAPNSAITWSLVRPVSSDFPAAGGEYGPASGRMAASLLADIAVSL